MEANGNGNGNGIGGNGNGNGNGIGGNAGPTNGSVKNVYTVVENKTGKAFWVKIGAAFTNRDGSLTVRLDALPLNGTMQVRDPTVWDDRRPDLANTAGGSGAPRHSSEAFA